MKKQNGNNNKRERETENRAIVEHFSAKAFKVDRCVVFGVICGCCTRHIVKPTYSACQQEWAVALKVF